MLDYLHKTIINCILVARNDAVKTNELNKNLQNKPE